jgi:hypothetical protein
MCVAQDRQQPGSRVAAVEAIDGAVGTQQSVLDEVLGVGGVAGQQAADTQQDLDLGKDVALERRLTGG